MRQNTAVITGAGGVLCTAFAKALAHDGMHLALLDINERAVTVLAEEINRSGGKAFAVYADVLDRYSLQNAHEKIRRQLGLCGLLLNGTGGNDPRGATDEERFSKEGRQDPTIRSFFDLDLSGISSVMNLNFLGTLLPIQEFAFDFIEAGCGNIINMSSISADFPQGKLPAYSASKAAVSNLTKWLAVHFAGQNIRVNAIAPGLIDTEQTHTLLYNQYNQPTKYAQKILTNTPMNRFGVPEDLLGTLRWLADDSASGFVTGVVVPVDGGLSAGAL